METQSILITVSGEAQTSCCHYRDYCYLVHIFGRSFNASCRSSSAHQHCSLLWPAPILHQALHRQQQRILHPSFVGQVGSAHLKLKDCATIRRPERSGEATAGPPKTRTSACAGSLVPNPFLGISVVLPLPSSASTGPPLDLNHPSILHQSLPPSV